MGRPISDSALYRKVEQDIRLQIESGRMAAGMKLADERSLSKHYAVSRTTIRQALSKLADDQWIGRVPGQSGTYVSPRSRQSNYLHVVTMSRSQWIGSYSAAIIAQAERSARRAGWRICLHRVSDAAEAGQVLAEVNNDPLAVGGMLEGAFKPDEVAAWAAGLRRPWVILSDLVESVRSNPVLHQVICDPFSSVQRAARCLAESGCRNPALFVFNREILWSQEAISAFRSVFDTAGIASENQQIFDLAALRPDMPMTAEENLQYNVLAMRQVVAHWKQTNRWPDGIILPEADSRILGICIRDDQQARDQLKEIQWVLTGTEETHEMLGHAYYPRRTTWVLASVERMMDVAVSLIQEQTGAVSKPRRRYIRDVRVVEDTAIPRISVKHDEADVFSVMV
ncbi:MAG: GntR family transcriptional regulator [Phycisphaeraceae bacterium]